MQAKILWIEGKRASSASFIPALRKKGYHVDTVMTGKAALEMAPAVGPHIVIVNAASLRSSGKRICLTMRHAMDGTPILLIANPEFPVTKEIDVNVVLELPFTIRKLVNRIEPLLPRESDKLIIAGPITLDLKRKLVRSKDRETRLTPRLAQLLRMFIEKPGEVLERNKLFKQVWKTDYMGDTRTLDVHISWLRGAIEENPRKPQLLKTIRGVGYRLDVET